MDLFINTSSTLEASASCLKCFEIFCVFGLPPITISLSVKFNLYIVFQCRLHNCRAYENSNCILKPRAFLGTYFLAMLIWFWKAVWLHSDGQHLWLLHICQLMRMTLVSANWWDQIFVRFMAPNGLVILEALALKNVLLDCNWIVMRLQSQQWKTTRNCYFINCFQFLITNANTKDMKTFSSCTYSASISLAVAKNIQEPWFYVTTMIWFSMASSQLQHCSSWIQEYFCHQMTPLKITRCALEASVQALKKLCNPLCLWSFFMRLFFVTTIDALFEGEIKKKGSRLFSL